MSWMRSGTELSQFLRVILPTQNALKKAKQDWIDIQRKEIDACLNKNNSKKAYQLVKDLTSENQVRSTTILDKSVKCFTKQKQILSRLTEYCSEVYNYAIYGNKPLDCSLYLEEDLQPILREEVEIAALKKETYAGVVYVPAELVQAEGESMIDF